MGFNASFRGNGYLEIDRNQFSTDIDQKRTTAVVVFSTTKSNGLLLWWGQKAGEEYEGGDFIAVAIVDGYVEYSLRLNGEETEIRNTDHLVNDGDRHIVILRRDDNTAMLEVDSLSTSGETRPTVRKAMHLPGNVFIGKWTELRLMIEDSILFWLYSSFSRWHSGYIKIHGCTILTQLQRMHRCCRGRCCRSNESGQNRR